MIDRTRAILPLSARWLLRVTGSAFAILAAPFLGAVGCWACGGITFVACCLWIALVAVVLMLLTIWPIPIGALLILAIARRYQNYRVLVTAGLAVGLTIWICWGGDWPSWCWEKQLANFTPTWGFGVHFWQRCCRWAQFLIRTFFKYQVYWYAAGVAAAGYAITAVALGCLLPAKAQRLLLRVCRRVRFRCPTCGRMDHRIRCPGCNHLHNDVAPSRHGIWTATCARCKEKLPTTVRRQARLDKVCGSCQASCHPEMGCLPEYHIAIVGAAASGKSVFMAAVLDFINQRFGPENGYELAFAGQNGAKEFNNWMDLLRSGEVLPPTPRSNRPAAFTVAVKRGRSGCLLYFYDASGWDIQAGASQGEGLGGHDFHAHIDGVILTVDPWAEQGLSTQVRANPEVKAAGYDAHYVLSRMISHWARMQGVAAEGRFSFPVAVAVTKMDVAGLASRVGGFALTEPKPRSIRAAAKDAASRSAHVRQLLEQSGSVDLLRLLESHFRRIRYFSVSSLGRTPDQSNRTSFQSQGTFAPLVWLMHQIGALPDVRGPVRSSRFLMRHAGQCLRGKEGRRARAKALGAIAAALFGVAGTAWAISAALHSDKPAAQLRQYRSELARLDEKKRDREKQMTAWRALEKEYRKLMDRRQFDAAARQLTNISAEFPEWEDLKEDFRQRSLKHLTEEANKAAQTKNWEAAHQSIQTFLSDVTVKTVLAPRDLAEFEEVKHELSAAEDRVLYTPLRSETTQSPEAIQAYLMKAPLRTMSREVEALRAYKQAMTEPLRIEARIHWGADCPHVNGYNVHIQADNRDLFNVPNVAAYQGQVTNLGAQSVARSSSNSIGFRITVSQEWRALSNWNPEKGEASQVVSLKDLGKGKEIKMSGSSGNKVFLRSPNAVEKPIMPEWHDLRTTLPAWWSWSLVGLGGIALLVAASCRSN